MVETVVNSLALTVSYGFVRLSRVETCTRGVATVVLAEGWWTRSLDRLSEKALKRKKTTQGKEGVECLLSSVVCCGVMIYIYIYIIII